MYMGSFRWFFASFLVVLFVFSGCIGTDYIADPPVVGEPSLEVSVDRNALLIGEMLQLTAVYFDEDGVESSPDFVWHSSDESVATVDPSGVLNARGIGQALISAEWNGVKSTPFLLTVVQNNDAVAHVNILQDSVFLSLQDSSMLMAQASTIDGVIVMDAVFAWNSTDMSIVEVDQDGLVVARSSGVAMITAEVEGVRSKPVVVRVESADMQMRTGMFQKKPGTSYDVQGTGILTVESGGESLLSFKDDFLCSDGPRLHVYLAERDRVEASSLDLGQLKANEGAQSYTIPEGAGLEDFNYVIIHCVPFNVTFGFAMLGQ